MSLTFQSSYPNATIWIAILYLDEDDCGNGQFKKAGWWSVTDGQSVEVMSGDLAWLNRYYYYYAEASDGAVWSGDINLSVTNNAFNQCQGDSSGDNRTVGFQLLDIGDDWSWTVNLVPQNYTPPADCSDGWCSSDCSSDCDCDCSSDCSDGWCSSDCGGDCDCGD